MEFKPKAKKSFESIIKEELLKGNIIRYDARDEKPIEVMGRVHIKDLSTMHNIGMEKERVEMEIFCSHDIANKVVAELAKTYSVRKVWCSYSGCCQYSTWGIYLDGE